VVDEIFEVGIHCARMALWRYEAVGNTQNFLGSYKEPEEKNLRSWAEVQVASIVAAIL